MNKFISPLFKQMVLLLLFFGGSFTLSAQDQSVSIELKNANLKEVLAAIESQTTYRFAYRNAVLDDKRDISISAQNASVSTILDQALQGRNIGYNIVSEKSIVIFDKRKEAGTTGSNLSNITVTGIIYDETQNPVIGANVLIVGSTIGTVSDIDGKFSIEAPSNGTLEISYIGYEKEVIQINGRRSINVTIRPVVLEEVVVVGYGTQKKASVTGAIDMVQGQLMEEMPVASIGQSLQGVTPGLIITDGGGKPGSNPTINIRGTGTLGNTEPLVVIDGIPAGMGEFNALNPVDIESLSVLKDASSTAIYGSRASNGVLLVTTKKGNKDRKPIIDINYSYSLQTPVYVPELNDSWDYAMLVNEAYTQGGGNIQFTPEQIAAMRDGSDPDHYANTNWWNEVVRPHDGMHLASVRVTGGSKKMSYMMSGGYTQQSGLIPYTSFSKYNVRMNLSSDITDNLNITGGFAYYNSSNQEPDHYSSIFGTVLNMAPYIPVKRSNGDWGHLNNEDSNPVAWITDGGHTKSTDSNVMMNLSVNWEIVKGLTFTGQISDNIWNVEGSSIYRTIPFVNDDGSIRYSNNPNSVSKSTTERNQYTLQTLLTYENTFGQHHFKVLGGFTDEHYKSHWLNANRENIPDNEMEEIDAATGTGDQRTVSGSSDEWRMFSYFGRLNYDYAGKYMAEFNVRYDGSSRLAPGRQYAVFPSGSIGWRLSEESFMDWSRSVLDNFKIRGSYGSVGNQTIDLYQYANVMANSTEEYMFGHAFVPGAFLSMLPNYDLTWETSTVLDFGVDFGLFNNRLSGTFDWYQKNTNNILLDLPVSDVIGISVSTQNAGRMKSWGTEFQLVWRDNVRDFHYSVGFSLADQMNEVVDLKGTGPYRGDRTITEEGHPLNTLYGYKCLGFFTSEEEIAESPKPEGYASQIRVGDLKYADISGPNGVPDGIIDSNDRTYLGWSAPRFMYGLDINGEWKGIDFRVFFQGVGKRDEFYYGSLVFNQTSKVLLENRWDPNQTVEYNLAHAKLPRQVNGQQNNYEISSFYVANAAYLRLKNLQVGYTLPQKWTQKASMEKVRFYFSANNLFTLTKFPYYDPEGSNGGSYYPQLTSYSFGVNITIGSNN